MGSTAIPLAKQANGCANCRSIISVYVQGINLLLTEVVNSTFFFLPTHPFIFSQLVLFNAFTDVAKKKYIQTKSQMSNKLTEFLRFQGFCMSATI